MASKDTRHEKPSYPRFYLMFARDSLNISAEELSRRIDVSKGYYYNLENGHRGHKMTVVTFARIIECLGLDAKNAIEEEVKYQKERDLLLSKNEKRNKTK